VDGRERIDALTRQVELLEQELGERRRGQAALAEELTLARRVLDTQAGLVIVLDAQGRTVLFNHACERLTGYTLQEVQGVPFWQLLVDAEDAPDFKSNFLRLTPESFPNTRENYWRCKDGSRRWIAWSNDALTGPDGALHRVVGMGVDLTRRKLAEEALRESQTLLMACQQSARIGSWVRDLATGEGRWTEQLFEFYGLEPTQAAPPADFVAQACHPDDREARNEAIVASTNSGRAFDIAYRIRRSSDGEERWLQTHGNVECDHEGRPARLLGVSRDITDERAAEERTRALEKKILEAQRLESLGVLAGGVAHDFNNLLVGILGSADLARKQLPEGSLVGSNVDDIIASASSAADLAKQMLAYSGRGKFVTQEIDLSELVQKTAKLMRASISAKATLHFELSKSAIPVKADLTQLRQVVMNLVMNGSEAMSPHGGRMVIRTGVRHCEPGEPFLEQCKGEPVQGDYAYLSVEDSGVGMDEVTERRVFEPFFSTKFTGRGLGLASVLGAVRGHDGAIHVDSVRGRGTTFTVLLPLSAGKNNGVEVRAAKPAARASLAGRTVLFVDDDDLVRRVVTRMLSRALELNVMEARDGLEALRLFGEAPDRYDLVLLDLTMPNMDGEQTLARLREVRPNVRVVLSSGYGTQGMQERFAGRSVHGFIQKPFRVDALESVLAKALSPASAPEVTTAASHS